MGVPQIAQRAASPNAHGVETNAVHVTPAIVDPFLVILPLRGSIPTSRRSFRGHAREPVGGGIHPLIGIGIERRAVDQRRARQRQVRPGKRRGRGMAEQAGEKQVKGKAERNSMSSRSNFQATTRKEIVRSGRCGWQEINGQPDQHRERAEEGFVRMLIVGLHQAKNRDHRKGNRGQRIAPGAIGTGQVGFAQAQDDDTHHGEQRPEEEHRLDIGYDFAGIKKEQHRNDRE